MNIRGLSISVILLCSVAVSQVQVTDRTSQTEYLEGEPVFAVVDVKNVGEEPIGYSYCDGAVVLRVAGQKKLQEPNLRGGTAAGSSEKAEL